MVNKTRKLFVAWLIVLFLFLLCSVFASPVFAGDEQGLAAGISLRAVGAFSRNYSFAPFFGAGNASDFLAQGILRATVEGDASKRLKLQLHAVQSVSNTTAPYDLSSISGVETSGTLRAIDTNLDWAHGRRTSASAWLDRFNVKIAFRHSDLTVGRQAVSLGKAWFWNPLDVFSPFDPNQFDRDYKAGVDAVRWDLELGDYSGVTLIAAAGREQPAPMSPTRQPRTLSADWDGSAAIARWFSLVHGWDVAVQGGKVYGGWQIGGGAVGEIGPYQMRFEGAQFIAQNSPAMPFPYSGSLMKSAFTGVFGIGRFCKSSLDLELEYLYNGEGDPDSLDLAFVRQQYGVVQEMGNHIIGLSASYEINPLTNGRITLLNSISDQSVQVQPVVSRSMSNNSELLMGATLNMGPRPNGAAAAVPGIRSEFGSLPNTLFLEWKSYY